MKRSQFVECMAYLEAGCGVPLDPKALQVYFDLLGDLEAPVLRTACKRVILEHPWKTFPSVSELRTASAEILQGKTRRLSAGEAWEAAWRASGRIDMAIEGSAERAMKDLPAAVRNAMRIVLPSMVSKRDPSSVIRSQFVKAYEVCAERAQREALLPLAVRSEVARLGGDVEKKIAQIGRMPE